MEAAAHDDTSTCQKEALLESFRLCSVSDSKMLAALRMHAVDMLAAGQCNVRSRKSLFQFEITSLTRIWCVIGDR